MRSSTIPHFAQARNRRSNRKTRAGTTPKTTKAGKRTSKDLVFAIGPHKITVVFEHLADSSTKGYFITDKDGGRLHISSMLDESHTMEVLFHELIHAIDYYFGLNLDHTQVHGLGTGLAQALWPLMRKE